jgi:DNA-binding CsgD family transcriptional regulator
MLIQLGADCGCVFAGLLILLLVYYFWNRDSIELYKVFLLPIVILALWISSSYINEGWVFLYLVLLDSAHKLVLFIIMLSPFMVKVGTSRLFPWCLAYLGFTAGKMSSSILRALTPIIPSAISSIIILGILFASSMLPALLASSRKDEASTQVNTEGTNNGKNEKNTLKLLNAIQVLVERHSLTSREKEVLMLLAKGRTAKYIAETLFISQLTAETHRKNIYAKIQVHTQQELISMVEKVMKEHRLKDMEQYKGDS